MCNLTDSARAVRHKQLASKSISCASTTHQRKQQTADVENTDIRAIFLLLFLVGGFETGGESARFVPDKSLYKCRCAVTRSSVIVLFLGPPPPWQFPVLWLRYVVARSDQLIRLFSLTGSEEAAERLHYGKWSPQRVFGCFFSAKTKVNTSSSEQTDGNVYKMRQATQRTVKCEKV